MENKKSNLTEKKSVGSCPPAMTGYVLQDGTKPKEGMKVRGFIYIHRSFGRTAHKDIEGILVMQNGKLKVNSFTEPEKFYPLKKFDHDWLTGNGVLYLERCT